MEKIVKGRLIHYYVSAEDPLTGEPRKYERLAFHGQRLHTEDGTNTDSDIYGVPARELKRLEVTFPDVFFSDAEINAAKAGVSDDIMPGESLADEIRGDRRSSPTISVTDPDASGVSSLGGGGAWHPLTFGEMSQWQIEEYLRQAEPTVEEILDAVEAQPDQGAREALLNKFLSAESAVTGGEPRDELVELAAARLGVAATGPGPDDDGLPHTLADHPPNEPGPDGTGAAVPPGGSGEDPGAGLENGDDGHSVKEPPVATENAVKFAEENDVDLSEVTGTGSEGRITQPDVEKYLASKNAQGS